MDKVMKKKMGLWLRKLIKGLRKVKNSDLKPFDGVIRVEAAPFEVRLKPNATLADLEHEIQKVAKLAQHTENREKK